MLDLSPARAFVAGRRYVLRPEVPHVGRARPTAGLGGRDQRRDQPVLVVAQRLPGAEVPDQRAILGRPHGDLRIGEAPRIAVTTAPLPPSSRPAHPFKTGCQITVPSAT